MINSECIALQGFSETTPIVIDFFHCSKSHCCLHRENCIYSIIQYNTFKHSMILWHCIQVTCCIPKEKLARQTLGSLGLNGLTRLTLVIRLAVNKSQTFPSKIQVNESWSLLFSAWLRKHTSVQFVYPVDVNID